MCCPIASKNVRIAYFKKYPRMVRAYLRAAQKYRERHPDTKTVKRYDDVYEWFTRDVFYQKESDWQSVNNNAFGKPDYKEFLEKQFGIDLTL